MSDINNTPEKECTRCNKKKPIADFNKDPSHKDGHASACRICRNKDWLKYKTGVNLKKREMGAFIDGYKTGPCLDCGNVFPDNPECMDFDHRNPETKIACVSRFRYDHEKALIEMRKCDLICANCHRIRTKARARSLVSRD